MFDDKAAIEMIVEDYRRETGEDVSMVADVYLDRARAAHHERLAGTGYCRGGYCCDGTVAADVDGEPAIDPHEAEFGLLEEFPVCAGTCGDPCDNPSGMCYQCQCEAHAEGWYSMDDGYARMGRSDAEIHRGLETR